MQQLADSRLKIKRADKNIADTKQRIDLVTGLDGQTSRREVHPDAKAQTIHYELTKLDELPEIALIVGDAIHNLKTALDYGWNHTIAIFSKGMIGKFSKFPVYPSVDDLEGALKGIHIDTAIPQLFKLMMCDIKPYRGGDDFLWAIHHYDISDKHRLLIPTTNYGNVSGIKAGDQSDIWTLGGELSKSFRVVLVGDLKIKDDGRVSVEIVFKDGPLKSLELFECLQIFSSRVLRIIEMLEKF